jgi:hypothetical protein
MAKPARSIDEQRYTAVLAGISHNK